MLGGAGSYVLLVDDAVEEQGNRRVVMADPEGNELCVYAGQGGR